MKPRRYVVSKGKFLDSWVVDRTLFDFVSTGACACCGLPYLFNPDGLKGLIEACTDIDTDAAEQELHAKSPWPPEIREQVWGDRVRLRLKMKREMKHFKSFLTECSINDVKEFCLENVSLMKRIFQMPRMLIMEKIKDYDIHSSYSNVLSAVVEQVANFKLTKYEIDGLADAEIEFEKRLGFNKRGTGFNISLFDDKEPDKIDVESLDIFFEMFELLGGPKLLFRRCGGNEKNGEEDDENDSRVQSEAGFRGDRRLVRLIIARFWAKQVMEKYLDDTKEKDNS